MPLVERIWRRLFSAVEVLVALVAISIFASVVYAVFSRYLFNASVVWADELPSLLLIWLTFIGSALLCHTDGNLRFDGLSASMPLPVQRIFEAVNAILILAFLALMTWYGWQLSSVAWSREAVTLPISMGIVRGIVPLTGVLMMGVYFVRLWRAIRGTPQSGEDML